MSETGHLAATILRRGKGRERVVVGIAGPPASGKTTLAASLADAIRGAGESAAVVPMDGFHFDDAVLVERGHRERKGAPHTFDFGGLHSILKRLREREDNVAVPIFDRSLEIARAGAAIVPSLTRFVIVEGNYLLFDEEPWRRICGLLDLTLFLDVPRAELERRLRERWAMHGKSEEQARAWIAGNDLPNVELVLSKRIPADLVLSAQPA